MSDCYVYVIAKRGDDGLPCAPVKVGISNSAEGRISSIQIACPFKIVLVYAFGCPNREIAYGLERSFHATQREHRLNGEWFDHHPLNAMHLLCLGYRAMLGATCPDVELHGELLSKAGVLYVEKRFGLAIPTKELN